MPAWGPAVGSPGVSRPGDSIAYRIFDSEDPIGKEIDLDGVPFTVIGVMQAKFQDSMNNGPDENRAIIPSSTYRAIYGDRYVNHLLLRPRSVERAEVTKREINEVLGAKHKFDPTDERALPMWDFIESEAQTRAIGLGIQLFLGLVGIFTLIVAGVGVADAVGDRDATRPAQRGGWGGCAIVHLEIGVERGEVEWHIRSEMLHDPRRQRIDLLIDFHGPDFSRKSRACASG